jgi:hypothetical protein
MSAFLVLLDDLLDLGPAPPQHLLLGGGDHHVIHADRDAGARGVLVAERPQLVRQEHRLLVAVRAVAASMRAERAFLSRTLLMRSKGTFGGERPR